MTSEIKQKILSKIPTKDFYFKPNLTPYIMFADMMDFLNYSAKTIGADAFSVNFTPINPKFMLSVIFFGLIVLEHFYWIYVNFNDFSELMLILISAPILPQGFIRIYSFIIRHDKLLDVFGKMKEFYLKYYTPITRKVMEESVVRSCNLCMLLTILTCGGCLLVILYPVVVYYVSGNL